MNNIKIIKKLEKNIELMKDKDSIVLVKLSLQDAKDLATAFNFENKDCVLSEFQWKGINFDLTSSSSYIVGERSIHVIS